MSTNGPFLFAKNDHLNFLHCFVFNIPVFVGLVIMNPLALFYLLMFHENNM